MRGLISAVAWDAGVGGKDGCDSAFLSYKKALRGADDGTAAIPLSPLADA
jgi:hypothetical protein